MNRPPMGRRALVVLAIAAVGLIVPAAASAHARVSPAVSVVNKLQLYSLAVPTEKSGLTTTKLVMTVPSGFGIDSYVAPAAPWHVQLAQTGSGNSAVITKVTLTGGHTPSGEDTLFQFLAQPASAQDVHVPGRADLFGRLDRQLGRARVLCGARADDPGRELARRWRGLGGDDHRARARRTGAAGRRLRARRRLQGAEPGMSSAALGSRSSAPRSRRARASERGVRPRLPGQDGAGCERDPEHSAAERPAHVRRGGRAEVRDHLGHRRGRPPGDHRAPHRSPSNPDTLVVPLRPHLPPGWYLIYWRAISVDGHPVQGAFTYAVGPNPGPAPQFRVPSIAASATSTNLLIARWVMFVSVMSAIGCSCSGC